MPYNSYSAVSAGVFGSIYTIPRAFEQLDNDDLSAKIEKDSDDQSSSSQSNALRSQGGGIEGRGAERFFQ
jgi:hypothetical protein